jgi:hypothetical protein
MGSWGESRLYTEAWLELSLVRLALVYNHCEFLPLEESDLKLNKCLVMLL